MAGFREGAGALTSQALLNSLYWLYDRVAAPGAPQAAPVTEADIDRLIRRVAAQAGTVGFAANLGGLLTLPIALPANLAGVSSLQLRLIADIARARGHDTESEAVRTMTIACLAGTAVVDILKDVGVSLGMGLTRQALTRISGPVLARVGQAAGTTLVARLGGAGAARIVPVVGGLISGTVDGLATAGVGAAAKRVFVRAEGGPDQPFEEPG